MSLSDAAVTLAGLVQIDLPARTLRFADGGMVKWGSDVFDVSDDVFGALAGMSVQREGLGDLAPGLSLSIIPPGDAAASTLSNKAMQGSRVRIWLAEVSRATGQVSGTPDLLFDGIVDVPRLALRGKARMLEIDMVSQAERLFLLNRGNVLSTRFHQTLFAGELGFDGADGVPMNEAWGAQSPPTGTVSSGRGLSAGAYSAFVLGGI